MYVFIRNMMITSNYEINQFFTKVALFQCVFNVLMFLLEVDLTATQNYLVVICSKIYVLNFPAS